MFKTNNLFQFLEAIKELIRVQDMLLVNAKDEQIMLFQL